MDQNNTYAAGIAGGAMGLAIYAMMRLNALEKRVIKLEQGDTPENPIEVQPVPAKPSNVLSPGLRSALLVAATLAIISMLIQLKLF